MNQRRIANLVIYNTLNVAIREIYKTHKRVFEKYKNTLKSLHKRLKTTYKSGSIKYYHDTRVVEFINPLLLEKLGEDFNYWMIEVNETIMSVVEPLVQYMDFVNDMNASGNREKAPYKRKIKDNNITHEFKTLNNDDYKLRKSEITEQDVDINLLRLRKDLDSIYGNMKSPYQLDKDFLSQGPKITCDKTPHPYILSEWFQALDFSVNNFQDIEANLEKMILTIEVLDKSIYDLKIKMDKATKVDRINVSFDTFMNESLSEGDFLMMEQKLLRTIRTNVKKCMDNALIRFGNYKKQCEYTLINLEMINRDN